MKNFKKFLLYIFCLSLILAFTFASLKIFAQDYHPYYSDKVLYYCDSMKGKRVGSEWWLLHRGDCLDFVVEALCYAYGDSIMNLVASAEGYFPNPFFGRTPKVHKMVDEPLPGDIVTLGHFHIGFFLAFQGDSVLIYDQNPHQIKKCLNHKKAIENYYRPDYHR